MNSEGSFGGVEGTHGGSDVGECVGVGFHGGRYGGRCVGSVKGGAISDIGDGRSPARGGKNNTKKSTTSETIRALAPPSAMR